MGLIEFHLECPEVILPAAAQGIDFIPVQQSHSFNASRATLRGMHYQLAPHVESKLVRCIRGRVFDVVVDLRKDSPDFGKWLGLELSSEDGRSIYIPPGLAHGFITLEDNCELQYEMDVPYHQASARTLHWNSSDVGIEWPVQPVVISEKDSSANSELAQV